MNYGNYFKYLTGAGEMKNFGHNFYLSKDNKSENYIKSDYDKSNNFDPENRLKKIKKIHILFYSSQISN